MSEEFKKLLSPKAGYGQYTSPTITEKLPQETEDQFAQSEWQKIFRTN